VLYVVGSLQKWNSSMDHLITLCNRTARRAICALDALLRHLLGIYEFSQNPDCILRISRGRSRQERVLSDGTVVHVGDPVIELHFWNEHVPRMDAAGPDLAWGLRFYRRLRRSLVSLARYTRQTPGLDDVVAFHGELWFTPEPGPQQCAAVLRALGFDFIPRPPPTNVWQRIARFFERLHVWALIWAFNPGSLKSKRLLTIEHGELWMSRKTLLQRYTPGKT
jgi:hypothetical protein